MVNKVDGNNYYVYTKQKKLDVPDTGEKFNLDYKQGDTSSETKNKKEVSEEEKRQEAERLGVRLELSGNGGNADAGRRKQEEAAKSQNTSARTPLFETVRTYVMSVITAVREFFRSIWNDQPSADVSREESAGTEQDASLEILQEMNQDMSLDPSGESAGQGESLEFLGESAGQGESLEFPGEAAGQGESLEFSGKSAGQGALLELSGETVQDEPWEVFGEAVRNAAPGPSHRSARETGRSGEEIIDASDERSVLAMDEERRNREIQKSLRDGNMEQVIRLLTENGKRTVARNSTLLTSYDKNGRVVEPNASDRQRALYGDKNTWKL